MPLICLQVSATSRWELRDYPRFVQTVDAYVRHFGLGEFTRKQIDKFLWIEGVKQYEATRSNKDSDRS